MTRRTWWASRVTIAATVGCIAVIAYLLLWTTYMVYDDEGYVLYSLRTFSGHGHLYDQVYSQYGPFFFVLYAGLHRLGLVFTNTTARALALICWVGAAGACGALVWRASGRRWLASVVTLVAVFVHLLPMSSEPSHPGGLIALLTAIAAWSGANPRWRSGTRALLVSAIAAMLVLTKINVGLFLFIGAGAWWLLQVPALAARPWTRWAVAVAIAAVPVLLMHGSFREPWVRTFTLVVAAAAAAVVLASGTSAVPRASARDWLPATSAAVAVAIVTFLVILAAGTSFHELIGGVILGPLRHPSLYWVALTWRTGAVALALAAVPLALWAAHLAPPRRAAFIMGARLVVLAGYAAALAGLLPFGAPAFVMSYGLATCWAFVLPVREDDALAVERCWIALLVVMQALHAFPVAGSQVSWGTFLWVPLAVLGAMDAGVIFASAPARRIGLIAVAGATLAIGLSTATVARAQYRDSDDLAVTGAERLRLPESFTTAVRMLVRNAQVHADVLFTLPGMMSFNAWTGVPPPTTENATHWFNLLSPAQQDAILRRLEASPRAALIVQRYVYDLVNSQHFVHPTPLLEWLLANYKPVFKVESYEFWVPKDRVVAPVDAARLFVGAAGSPLKYKLEIVIAPPQPIDVATIEFRAFARGRSEPVGALTDANARFFSVPITPAGEPAGAVAERKLPWRANGLTRIEAFTNAIPPVFASHPGVIYLRDGAGRRVAEARLIE